jgi:hypothetical protein
VTHQLDGDDDHQSTYQQIPSWVSQGITVVLHKLKILSVDIASGRLDTPFLKEVSQEVRNMPTSGSEDPQAQTYPYDKVEDISPCRAHNIHVKGGTLWRSQKQATNESKHEAQQRGAKQIKRAIPTKMLFLL